MVGLLIIALTVVGVVGWHVTETEAPWWKSPIFGTFSDRRHAFSWLSYWPACGWICWREVGWPWGSWEQAGMYAGVLAVSKLIWSIGKRLAGKDWPYIGVQLINALKRR